LRNRWGILAVLFTVRLTMAFQFQSVAAVAPLLGTKFGVSLADIGILIGLYFTPGIALALPGGAIGQKFGDKATVTFALALMLVGELTMAASEQWGWQIAGRLVAGGGGVLLNVLMTKMITDWFAGKEIATALAVFVNSWPAGIAISLLILPAIGVAHGVAAVYLAVAALIAIGILLLLAGYRAAPGVATASVAAARPDGRAILAVIAAGLIWGLFNTGFAIIFSFGPSLLAERGWSITAAGSAISIVLWLSVASVPAGGLLADRFKRPRAIMTAGFLVVAALMLALPRSEAVIAVVIALGLVGGLPDHEPARLNACAGNARDRHGDFLHRLLCRHDAGPRRRRCLRQMVRHGGGGLRLRRGHGTALPAPAARLQPDCHSRYPSGSSPHLTQPPLTTR
jgi:MFS family permease